MLLFSKVVHPTIENDTIVCSSCKCNRVKCMTCTRQAGSQDISLDMDMDLIVRGGMILDS
jgi:hypothetical protein